MDMNYIPKMSYNQFFNKTMKWLVLGVGLTALTSLLLDLTGVVYILTAAYYPIMVAVSLIEIVMVIIISKNIEKLSYQKAKRLFIAYSIINGITMSFVLAIVGPGVSLLAFLITFVYFGLLYTITKNTDNEFIGVGKICLAGLPILIITYCILLFVHAPVLYFIVTIVDLVLFTGLTLFDIKKIRNIYNCSDSDSYLEKISLICALELYLDFINILLDIIHLIYDSK